MMRPYYRKDPIMPKSEIVNTEDVTVRVNAKDLAIKVATMVVATGVSMAAVHIVQKAIESRKG